MPVIGVLNNLQQVFIFCAIPREIGDRHLRTFPKAVCRQFNESCRLGFQLAISDRLCLSDWGWHC
ncbi:MAG: hypothetical protein EA001_02860 [Oscillatoriales cyanobacterium]|nr:MAG: hypothetical protein EA001_02860 [Oscillatoriales cyanobacterium]